MSEEIKTGDIKLKFLIVGIIAVVVIIISIIIILVLIKKLSPGPEPEPSPSSIPTTPTKPLYINSLNRYNDKNNQIVPQTQIKTQLSND